MSRNAAPIAYRIRGSRLGSRISIRHSAVQSAVVNRQSLLSEPRVETVAAPRLVGAPGADEHALAAGHEPLRVIGGRAADHAESQRLCAVFRDGGAPRPPLRE